jgi:hypothetical protein
MPAMPRPPTLKLVRESKIRDLLPAADESEDFEASGVLAMDGCFFVVFDNRTEVAKIADDFRPNDSNGLFGTAPIQHGYEGIAHNPTKNRFYLLVESVERDDDEHTAEIIEYTGELEFRKRRRVEFVFKTGNKGFEALAYVRRDDRDYALALCEGNRCRGGNDGREPGKGRVQLFEKKKKRWSHIGRIKIPSAVRFTDYSGMALDENNRVAIVSQENSMLWVGRFEESSWNWSDDGKLYAFPRMSDGEICYGNIEGVSWITPHQVVTVSDRRKKSQPEHFAAKDQSIHMFDLPGWQPHPRSAALPFPDAQPKPAPGEHEGQHRRQHPGQ